MGIREISVIGGFGRDGAPEPVARLDMRMDDVVSIVGPTGSGKTALINDIALFADADTPSWRRVLVNGALATADFGEDLARNPIALITQHTTFLSDLPVREFLGIHAKIRQAGRPESIVGETLAFANELTGEPIIERAAMTALSGGQTRALLLADAVVIGNSPIILLDEIECAGIDRLRAPSTASRSATTTSSPTKAWCARRASRRRSAAAISSSPRRAGPGQRSLGQQPRHRAHRAIRRMGLRSFAST